MAASNVIPMNTPSQVEIEIELRNGAGKAAFFADVTLRWGGREIVILGCPIWKKDDGTFLADLPKKAGKKPGTSFKLIKLDRDLWETMTKRMVQVAESRARPTAS